MKLQHKLILSFSIVAIVPLLVVSLILYTSGMNLAKQSYESNLKEMTGIQASYIERYLADMLIADSKFVGRYALGELFTKDYDDTKRRQQLLNVFRLYLEMAEDKITACFLLGTDNEIIYCSGTDEVTKLLAQQFIQTEFIGEARVREYQIKLDGTYGTGISTPVIAKDGQRVGTFVTICDNDYIAKLISGSYQLAEATTYISRANGDLLYYKKTDNKNCDKIYSNALKSIKMHGAASAGFLVQESNCKAIAHYQKIARSPWYLVNFINYDFVSSFANQFLLTCIILELLIIVIIIYLALRISKAIVLPINCLINTIDDYYQATERQIALPSQEQFVEIQYLNDKFYKLMTKMLNTQENLGKIYNLYQSIMSSTVEITVEIDLVQQTLRSNNEVFQRVLQTIPNNAPEQQLTCLVIEEQRLMFSEILNNLLSQEVTTTQEVDICLELEQRQIWYELLIVPMYEQEQLTCIFVHFKNIDEQKRVALQNINMATRDHLTGLYNRLEFTARAEQIISNSGTGDTHAVFFIDLDGFKKVNDTFGHRRGDEILLAVARVLTELGDDAAVVCRNGGDEFTLLLKGANEAKAQECARLLCDKLYFKLPNGSEFIITSASIGIAMWNDRFRQTVDELLEIADRAMYKAKNNGKNGYYLAKPGEQG